MNVSSTYHSHIVGSSDVELIANSSKCSMYILASTGDSGEPIAKPSYMLVHNMKSVVSTSLCCHLGFSK